MLNRRVVPISLTNQLCRWAIYLASDENEFSNDREGQGQLLEARFPFLRDDIVLVAQVNARTGKQQLFIQQINQKTGDVLRETSVDCIHVAVCDATVGELDDEVQRHEVEEASLHIRSSELLTEIHLTPEEKFVAFKSWAAGIAEAGLDAFHIQEEIDEASHLQLPLTTPLMQFLAEVDVNFLFQYLEYVERASNRAGVRHEAFLLASLVPVLKALRVLDPEESEYNAVLDQIFALKPPLKLFMENEMFGDYLELPQVLDLASKELARLAARWQTITNQQREKALIPFLDVLARLPKQSPQANEIAEKIFALLPPLSAFFDDYGDYLEFLLSPAAIPIIERDLAGLGLYPGIPTQEAAQRLIKDIEERREYGIVWLFAPEYEVMVDLDRLSGKRLRLCADSDDIACNFVMKQGHVIGLDLHRLKLQELPSMMHQLTLLRRLNASENQITKLPDNYGMLQNLEKLDLSHNRLIKLPNSFGNLRSLKYLDISFNFLEYLPDSIANLQSLEVLNLCENHLRILPECIGDIRTLRSLNVGANELTRIPESLGNLIRLEKLFLIGIQLTIFPELIGNFSKLEILYITSSSGLTTLPDIFDKLPRLKYLDIGYTKLKGLPPSLRKSMNNGALTVICNDQPLIDRKKTKSDTPTTEEMGKARRER